MYQPLHHKYRPQTFADLVGQEAIATTLGNALENNRIAPAYLFTGPRGTGKTSSARIFAKSLNCEKSNNPTATPCGECSVCKSITNGSALDVIEIDAASNTGVDNIREIIERAQFAPVQCRYKVYVIDECHMLSTAAFNALLKTLEEPPNRVIFILATTDPQRVLPTIISRCQRFDYRRIPLDSMVKHLQHIAENEGININLEAVTIVAQIANGGLRDAESLLDQLSLLAGEITVEKVWDLVGSVPEQDLFILLEAIRNNDSEKVLSQCRNLMNRGKEPLILLQNLAGFYLNLLIAKTAPQRNDLVAVTTPTWEKLCQESQYWEVNHIIQGQQKLKGSEFQIRNTTQPRLWLEITLLGLLPSAMVTQQVVVTQNVTPTPPKTPSNQVINNPPVSSPPPKPINNNPPVSSNINTPENVVSINRKKEAENINNNPPVNEVNQENIWDIFLSKLQPFDQAFLSQQCSFLSFNGHYMEIGVKNSNLLKIAQSKAKKMEQTLAQIKGSHVKIEFKVVNSGEKKNRTSVNNSPSTPNNYPRENHFDEEDNYIPKNNIAPITRQPSPDTPKKQATERKKQVTPEPKPEPKPNTKNTNEEINLNLDNIDFDNITEWEFNQIVNKFAQNFKGEIVNLDDLPTGMISEIREEDEILEMENEED